MSIKSKAKDIKYFINQYTSRPFVTYSESSGCFYFNAGMTKKLNIKGWAAVMVGYDKASGVFALRKVNGGTYGSVKLKKDPNSKHPTRSARVSMVSRTLTLSKLWNAEMIGNVVYLEKAKV